MSETRIFPKYLPRGTGIKQTNLTRPLSNASGISHVSASAGSGSAGQAQARTARSAPGRVQDATVQIIDRTASPAASNRRPTVELLDRRGAHGVTKVVGGVPTTGGSPFALDEAALIGMLLEKFSQNATVIGDVEGTKIAERALEKVGRMVSTQVAPAPTTPARTPASAGTPTFSAPTVTIMPTAVLRGERDATTAEIVIPAGSVDHADTDVTGASRDA